MGEVPAHEFDEDAGMGAPVRIELLLSLEQVSRKIQRRPGRSIRGSLVVFEELSEQCTVGRGAGNLVTLGPFPERPARNGEFRYPRASSRS